MDETTLMTTEDVAGLLRVDERTVTNYRQLKKNPLPFIKLGGAIRFDRGAVEAWLKERTNG